MRSNYVPADRIVWPKMRKQPKMGKGFFWGVEICLFRVLYTRELVCDGFREKIVDLEFTAWAERISVAPKRGSCRCWRQLIPNRTRWNGF